MGFVDRGGGRESKGGSLRRSTKNPGAAAARLARAVKAAPVAAGPSPPPPPLAKPSPELGIDFGVALLSRLLDASREGMWDRAHAEGQCAAAVIWSSEMAKQEEVLRLCSERPGVIYAAVGVHPDNIDRTNKRAQDTWLESLEALARTPACVALLSGLNLQRDHATHYFQESLLQATAALAVKLDLPLMLHVSSDAETIERTVSLLQEQVQESKLAVLIHNIVTVCGGAPKTAELLANAGFYASVSAAGLATEAELAVAVPVLSAFPMERFVIGTNSPWNTPQNISDEHLRELANEPCNLQYVINAVASALGIATGDATNATSEEGEAEAAKSTTTLTEFKERLRTTSLELMGFMKVRAPTATAAEEAQAALEKREAGDEDDEDSDESAQADDAKAANGTSAKVEAEEETLRAVPIRNAKAATVFSCVKCRAELFNQLALVTHPVGARAAVFESKAKKQTHGSCAAALFVDMSSAETDDALGVLRASSAPGISIAANMDVSCATCKCKIGGAQQEAACPCGLVVPGLTARIVASRVDMITTDASQDDILARAAAEQAQQARRAEAGDTASDSDDDRPNKTKEAKKNVKQQNRSNMSNFRNKNWTPGMAKVAEDVVAEQSLGKGGKGGAKRKKGQRRGDSDSD